MKLTYKQRLFGIIFVIFAVFSLCIIISEQREERKFRTEALESKLDGYVEVIHRYIEQKQLPISDSIAVPTVVNILPEELRVTLIDAEGNVFYENDTQNIKQLGNHLDRPEIMKALYQDYGSNIRMSASMNHEYLYYAKFFGKYFVRVALPYNIQVKNVLQPDNFFIYIVLVMFVIVFILLNLVAGRFEKSITKLRDITSRLKNDQPLPTDITFPDDELGDMGKELVDIFNFREESKLAVELEREKLIQHFQFSETGLCIFSPKRKKIYANSHFLQNINQIVDKPIFDADNIFGDKVLQPIDDFFETKRLGDNHLAFQVAKNAKTFNIQVIVFDDQSFEITIRDVTQVERNRQLKQEMTNNIAHELRTPVTSLRGFLETLHDQDLPAERQSQFIERAYLQSIRLSNLIEDISLLSKIDEASNKFTMDKVNLVQVINEVRIDLTDRLKANNIDLFIKVNPELTVHGNETLLYSIFRNLMDNTINYAGKDIEIHIKDYMEDNKFVYISYYDTGIGVDEQHMVRLFERFYRVNEGRTRETGGSGLGLSIVKNAVKLHKGEIHARKFSKGGLEFLFTLAK
ncbi:sensor histidine kinase [Dysgonomonas macrotermitis]|uniref:histidine kinase n=1 Tax=Dysgonomonas macrotermitis TaxID=1346286 RepID=A0A1M4U3X0_9BACT|nr:ATP-binding protein [Dysgonomonas macrotermitis]SHE51336.1 two-component system, OmpR family, sensor kinase/two-component system, OmpR family, phosphate regulon sensor histidine kinase PhoR [Dysgonomonas macrotermitis]